MVSNHKIQMALEEIKDIARVEMALYNESGKLLAATFRNGEDFESAVMDFAVSMAESQTLADSHFFKDTSLIFLPYPAFPMGDPDLFFRNVHKLLSSCKSVCANPTF